MSTEFIQYILYTFVLYGYDDVTNQKVFYWYLYGCNNVCVYKINKKTCKQNMIISLSIYMYDVHELYISMCSTNV